MTEVVDSLVRSDLVKPTVISIAHVNAHRRDLAFRPIDDVPPLRLGPIWLAARDSAAIRAFVSAAHPVRSLTNRGCAVKSASSTGDRLKTILYVREDGGLAN